MSEDVINHPKHYKSESGVECIEIAEHLGFNLGNAFKYLFRRNKKGRTVEDLQKALWYLKRAKDNGDQGCSYLLADSDAFGVKKKIMTVVEKETANIREAMIHTGLVGLGYRSVAVDRFMLTVELKHAIESVENEIKLLENT